MSDTRIVQIIKTGAERREERIKGWIDRILAIVAVVSAIAAIASAIAAHKDAAESLRKQQDAVNAQIDSVKAQIKAMQMDQRPFIKVEYSGLESYPLPGMLDHHVALIKLTSLGRTPARGVAINLKCSYTLGQLEKAPYVNFAVLYSNESEPFREDCTGKLMDKAGRVSAVVYGSVDYTDIFDTPHRLTFCFIASPTKKDPHDFDYCDDFKPELT